MKVKEILQNTAVWLITGYQKSLSPDHGWFSTSYPYGFCRHYPSCSQYTKEAIQKFGFFKGFLLGSARIARCNPFVQSSYDPVSSHH